MENKNGISGRDELKRIYNMRLRKQKLIKIWK